MIPYVDLVPRDLRRVPRGATPSQVCEWSNQRLRAMGITPGAELPDARTCPTCGGRGWMLDGDGREIWCPGECRHTGYMWPPRYECPTCRDGKGWVTRDVPVEHPAFGKAIACPSCQTGHDQVAARLRAAHMPLTFQSWTLDTFGELATSDSRSAAWAEAGALSSDPTGYARMHGAAGLLLHGPAGVGKTGLAAAIVNSLARSGAPRIRWLAWRSWLGDLRTAMRHDGLGDPDMLVDLAGGADVLVVDDFGAAGQGETDWRRDVAWRLFERRQHVHRAGAAVTIVTSNLTPEALATAFGDPVVSRILGVAVALSMTGDDERRAVAA